MEKETAAWNCSQLQLRKMEFVQRTQKKKNSKMMLCADGTILCSVTLVEL